MDESQALYTPISCSKCSIVFAIMRVRFGSFIKKDDFFINSQYVKKPVLTRAKTLRCPKCSQIISWEHLMKRITLGLVDQKKKQFVEDFEKYRTTSLPSEN